MLKSSGRRVDLSSPFVDATLPDGSRLHVVIPDITGTARKCPQAPKVRVTQDLAPSVIPDITGTDSHVLTRRCSRRVATADYP